MLWKIYSIASSLLSSKLSAIKQFFSIQQVQHHYPHNKNSIISASSHTISNINMANISHQYYSVNIYVPTESSQKLRDAIALSKAGMIGNYDSCSFTTKGIGRFRPLENANPTIGTINSIEEVEEEKIEVVVLEKDLQNVLEAIVNAHPYEEPAIQVFPMIDYKSILSSISDITKTKQDITTTISNDNELVISTTTCNTTISTISTNTNASITTTTTTSNTNIIPGISIVIEGLDGVGKSTICKALAMKLNAELLMTPPIEMKSYRNYFVEAKTDTGEEDIALRKAYYMVGNFMIGNQMQSLVKKGQYVVLDRYYASTMAYILGKKKKILTDNTNNSNTNMIYEPLPPNKDDKILQWPLELYKPTYMFVIILPEEDRIFRRSLRLDIKETMEEEYLRKNSMVTNRINQLYLLYNCIPIYITKNESVDEIIDKIMNIIQER